jgi:autotransporter-associated beta strand protein
VVTLSGGTLSANSIGNGVNSAIGNSTNAIQYAGGSITYTGGTATISRAFTFTTNANGSFQNDSAGYVTYNGTLTGTNANFTLNGGSAGIGGTNDWQSDFGNGNNTPTVVVKGGSGNWFISGAIKTGTAGVSVGGTGTLTLNNNSNNFSGAMNVIGGATLNFTTITNVGAGASSVGAPTNNANGLFTLGSTADGTLNYIGTGSSTDRRIKIGNVTNAIGNARINNNGSGALVWTDPAFMNTQSNYTVNHTLTLGGTNTNANEIKGAILDQAAISTTSLIKADSGRWILSGTNTYTGATTVSAGTLQINGSVASSAITVSNAAVLGGTGSAGTVTVNGTFAPGAPATNGTFTVTSALSVPGTAQFRVFGNGINDQVIASGGASLSGTVSVLIDTNYAPASGDSYDFVTGVISNTPTLSLPALGGGLTWVTNTFLSTGVLSITNGGATPYDTWVAYWQTNSSGFTNTAGTDNPDGDPFDNNEEFAFDGNPTVGTGALLTAVKVGTNAVFNYVAMTNTNAVTYQVQVTGNLTNGWTNASVTISNSLNQTNPVISQTNLYERKEFIVPATASQFYRVQATIVP